MDQIFTIKELREIASSKVPRVYRGTIVEVGTGINMVLIL